MICFHEYAVSIFRVSQIPCTEQDGRNLQILLSTTSSMYLYPDHTTCQLYLIFFVCVSALSNGVFCRAYKTK